MRKVASLRWALPAMLVAGATTLALANPMPALATTPAEASATVTQSSVDRDAGKPVDEGDAPVGNSSPRRPSVDRGTQSFSAVDAALFVTIVGVMTVAVKSLAKRGARACSGNCSCCPGGCGEYGIRLSPQQEEELRRIRLRSGR